MSYYGSIPRHGFDIDFIDDGRISIFQSRLEGMGGTDQTILLDAGEAEELVEQLRKFLDDVKSGKLSPPSGG